MKPDFDLLIIGAGCAGLSLALRLCAPEFSHLRICLLEARSEFQNDRTWCGWKPFSQPFESLVTHQWHRWKVSTGGQEVIRESTRHPYQCIPSSKFYEHAFDRLKKRTSLALGLGNSVTSVLGKEKHCEIATSQGIYATRYLIDSRPAPTSVSPTLFQVFLGIELELDEPLFDPSTVGLMEFENSDDISFLYTLPFSPTRVLLEWTQFRREPALTLTIAQIQDRLNVRFPQGWREIRREVGCIAMHSHSASAPQASRVLRIGADAGATRPATGYAFGAIQRQANQVAQVLRQNFTTSWPRAANRRLRPGWLDAMDRRFLRVLRDSPQQAPSLFLELFQRCPTERLIRFLSDSPNLLDALAVIASVPPRLFLTR